MGFFKKMTSKLSKSLLNTAKKQLTDSLKNQATSYLPDEAIVYSKTALFDQMNVLLASVKATLIELKIKARSNNKIQDDITFAMFMESLKEFSKSVIATIDEIEAY